jgi:antitoxin component YwqK of YwqJK toxin-antitoxin module
MKNLLFIIPLCLFSCSPSIQPVKNNMEVKLFGKDYYATMWILTLTSVPVKPEPDKFYYWFYNNSLHVTQGDYSGKLLHGQFQSYYKNDNLKEKGNFHYGLKDGLWQNWYPNGKYSSLSHWEKGRLNGKTILYNQDGHVVQEMNYRNGQLHGIQMQHDEHGIPIWTKYRNGKPDLKNERHKFKPLLNLRNRGKHTESNADN